MATMALVSAGFISCDDDMERPPVVLPQSTMEANTTIAELKSLFYKSDRNYAEKVGTRSDGEDYIIKGRIVSTDVSGDIFKQIFIEDETSGMQISVDSYDLYETYRYGQEIVINVSGLYMGAYGGLLQIGAAPTSTAGYPGRISSDDMEEHAEVNGLSDPDAVSPHVVTIPELDGYLSNLDETLAWQCRQVRLDNVSLKNAGVETIGVSGKSSNRYIVDGQGNQIILYTSGYSDFYGYLLPTGTGSITGILSYYGGKWQIRLMGLDAFEGFDEIVKPGDMTGDGSETSPFSVKDVQSGATGTDVWVKGYIVGWVDGKTLSDGAKFNASATVASNLLLADSPDASTLESCVPVQLPTGDVRTALNLKDNPGNYKKEVMVMGSLDNGYFGTKGVANVTQYKMDGADVPDTPVTDNASFKKVTEVTSGKTYLIIAEGNIAKPLSGDYGYLYPASAPEETDGVVVAQTSYGWVFTATEGGYTIQDSNGKYLYMKGTYNSFNLDTSVPASGGVWTITADNDAFRITNVEMGKTIQYSQQYNSYGAYPDSQGVLPALYEKVD